MKKLLLFIFVFLASQAQAQKFYKELYGFRLGQYREAVKNDLGKPFKAETYDDGYEYEAFLLKPDTSLYIVFEYAAGKTGTVWSIQVSGTEPLMDIGLANLGVGPEIVEKTFGKPTTIKDIGEFGHNWAYDKTNLSLEMNTDNKLSSIKIIDNSAELFPTPNLAEKPSFAAISKTLRSKNKAEILNLLAPDMEIYRNDSIIYIGNSFQTEAAGFSKVCEVLTEASKDLVKVNTKNKDEYEENIRLAEGHDPLYVIKLKKNHAIKEIVLKYYGGQFLIFEIQVGDK